MAGITCYECDGGDDGSKALPSVAPNNPLMSWSCSVTTEPLVLSNKIFGANMKHNFIFCSGTDPAKRRV